MTFKAAMFSRYLTMLGMLCGAGAFLSPNTAIAKSTAIDLLEAGSDFDLARHQPPGEPDHQYRLSDQDGAETFRSGKLGPHWSYSPVRGGPTVEVGALGGGRKGRPRLAHVGVDWRF